MPRLPPPPPEPSAACCFSARHQVVTEQIAMSGFDTVLCLLQKPAGNGRTIHGFWLGDRDNTQITAWYTSGKPQTDHSMFGCVKIKCTECELLCREGMNVFRSWPASCDR